MYAMVHVPNPVAQRTLEAMGFSREKILRVTCHAIAHGHWSDKKTVLVHEVSTGAWAIIVKE